MHQIKRAWAFMIEEDRGAIIGAACAFALPFLSLFIAWGFQ